MVYFKDISLIAKIEMFIQDPNLYGPKIKKWYDVLKHTIA